MHRSLTWVQPTIGGLGSTPQTEEWACVLVRVWKSVCKSVINRSFFCLESEASYVCYLCLLRNFARVHFSLVMFQREGGAMKNNWNHFMFGVTESQCLLNYIMTSYYERLTFYQSQYLNDSSNALLLCSWLIFKAK